jgi:hypothetical protein
MGKESFGNNPSTGNLASSIGTISGVIAFLKNVFNTPNTPLPNINKFLLLNARNLPGMSGVDLTTSIISRKAEAGIDTGPLPSGEDNIDLKMERIRVEETINQLQTKAKIEIVIPPGSIKVYGANQGGPVTSLNSEPITGYGVIR